MIRAVLREERRVFPNSKLQLLFYSEWRLTCLGSYVRASVATLHVR